MVKIVSVFAFAAVANAETVKLSYTDCGSSSTHAKITGLTPATIDVPGKASVVGSGSLDADQTSASFSLKVKKAGIPLVSGKGSICEDTTIKVPLGAGSFTVKGLDCPIKAGDTQVQVDLDILSDLVEDGENNLLSIHIEANADDTGDQVICLDVDASLAADDFDAYLNKFGKAYNGEDEYATRKAIFEANVEFINAENAKGHSYTLGVGPFADLTAEEFKATRLGYKKEESDSPVLDAHIWQGEELADSLDWTTQGAVTPVKDQGQCGSCWAFSTTGALESGYQISSGQLVSLSEQQYVDCDGLPNLGCMGGQMSSALKWAEKHDICTETSYPYTAKGGLLSSCKSSGCSVGLKSGSVTGVKNLNRGSDADLKSALQQQPISIAIEADENIFQHYTGGVITGSCGTNTDHGVLLVGYGTDGGNDYWKVKNSWGESWGESGFVRLVQGKNQCGINSGPNYPVFSASVSV